MKIVCASTVTCGEEAFSTVGDCVICRPEEIGPAVLKDADALVVRSTIKINSKLIGDSRLRFVGTATIGFDHMDLPFLEGSGIKCVSAAGCNANSVSEYITAALLVLAERKGFSLEAMTVGVVGVGNVGRRVAAKAEVLGMSVLRNDPPRARAGKGQDVDEFVELERLLSEADVVTLHVPLTCEGRDSTIAMADSAFFERMKRGSIFFNSARGGVMVSEDLVKAIDGGQLGGVVIDTWEGEPQFWPDLLDRVDIGTPHIAGHSWEGKVNGTAIVYRELCSHLGVAPSWKPPLSWEGGRRSVAVDAIDKRDDAVLGEIVRHFYNILDDDAGMRSLATVGDAAERAAGFSGLRKNYAVRREFPAASLVLNSAGQQLIDTANGLGFTIS